MAYILERPRCFISRAVPLSGRLQSISKSPNSYPLPLTVLAPARPHDSAFHLQISPPQYFHPSQIVAQNGKSNTAGRFHQLLQALSITTCPAYAKTISVPLYPSSHQPSQPPSSTPLLPTPSPTIYYCTLVSSSIVVCKSITRPSLIHANS